LELRGVEPVTQRQETALELLGLRTESRQIVVTHCGADNRTTRRSGRRRGDLGVERAISRRHPLSLQPRAERTKLHALRQDQPL
jgi:hypothetical protein